MQLVWALLLLALTAKGMPSAYSSSSFTSFSMLKEFLVTVARRTTPGGLPSSIHWSPDAIALSPLYLFIGFLTSHHRRLLRADTGPVGAGDEPEWVAMGLAASGAVVLVMFTSQPGVGRVVGWGTYSSAPTAEPLPLGCDSNHPVWAAPMLYSSEEPRTRRLVSMHVKRSIYDPNGQLRQTDVGVWSSTYDFRGVADLPEHSFLQSLVKLNCSKVEDDYCQLPYLHPALWLFPPE